MPAKKKPLAAKCSPSPSSEPATPVNLEGVDKINAKLFVAVANDLNTIRFHWPNIQDADPVEIDGDAKELSGFQAVFWEHQYDIAIKATSRYKCAINFMWLNMLYSPTPGVPIQESRVEGLMDFYFKSPAPYPIELIIAVPSKEYPAAEHKGALLNVSTEEIKMAHLRAIARDITSKAPKCVLEKWRHSLLTVTAEFRVLGSEDDIYFTAVNQREDITTKYHELARTAYQRIHEICLFKQRKEKSLGQLSAKRVAEEFNQRATLVPCAEFHR